MHKQNKTGRVFRWSYKYKLPVVLQVTPFSAFLAVDKNVARMGPSALMLFCRRAFFLVGASFRGQMLPHEIGFTVRTRHKVEFLVLLYLKSKLAFF